MEHKNEKKKKIWKIINKIVGKKGAKREKKMVQRERKKGQLWAKLETKKRGKKKRGRFNLSKIGKKNKKKRKNFEQN